MRFGHFGRPHHQRVRLELPDGRRQRVILQRRLEGDLASEIPQLVAAGLFELIRNQNPHVHPAFPIHPAVYPRAGRVATAVLTAAGETGREAGVIPGSRDRARRRQSPDYRHHARRLQLPVLQNPVVGAHATRSFQLPGILSWRVCTAGGQASLRGRAATGPQRDPRPG